MARSWQDPCPRLQRLHHTASEDGIVVFNNRKSSQLWRFFSVPKVHELQQAWLWGGEIREGPLHEAVAFKGKALSSISHDASYIYHGLSEIYLISFSSSSFAT